MNDHSISQTAAHPYIVAFQRDHLGDGPEDLGKILIKAFINTLPETAIAPTALVFQNSGVLLACEGSPVLEALKKLEARGIPLLSCGTCLDYYQKKEALMAGKVSNMYEIVETLSKAGHVLYP
jgi:selenium metabolism protein YedF